MRSGFLASVYNGTCAAPEKEGLGRRVREYKRAPVSRLSTLDWGHLGAELWSVDDWLAGCLMNYY